MGFKEWSKRQQDAKQFSEILIDTFQGCTKEEVYDVDFVMNTLRDKYGEQQIKWMYSIEQSSRQQGWDKFNRECLNI